MLCSIGCPRPRSVAAAAARRRSGSGANERRVGGCSIGGKPSLPDHVRVTLEGAWDGTAAMLVVRGRRSKGVPLPHVRPSELPDAAASRGGTLLVEREAALQVPEDEGVVLRRTADGKGDAVLATRGFAAGDTVMVGFLIGALTGNDSHATQVGPDRWARHGGLGPIVNHSCDPNCGVRLNDGQAFDFVARRPIDAGQELTFDYAMRNFTIDHFPAVCLCGPRGAAARSPAGRTCPPPARPTTAISSRPTCAGWTPTWLG